MSGLGTQRPNVSIADDTTPLLLSIADVIMITHTHCLVRRLVPIVFTS